mmetsp:Transcript_53079/g.95170  ORF Transcript_53079/g.95170 Transcript_53079/m.95170 type:complete len:567 (+) Transcript_53079:78-1778(+)|eukprot:CAMPEP_0197627356 /NCGR_PEP_ID=MMETSP1338-20131121/5989_1 /TAXON_ID=43686 ORGANISM="Pelagodinium beii, Strain RCC1491" /NCGR_SAMPLE_ID=MMETSP1338 /ASSEMBLY_ACC=CAM_ASM_000754 /LENGTH=566 /DNA_ID=CAMNT_0043198055 /DNA_START=48 /DNA_END=1748 /DNA_ORIENTATION=-
MSTTAAKAERDGAEVTVELCAVCYDRPSGWTLDPCGHTHFCETCAAHFRTCPICRRPVKPPSTVEAWSSDGAGTRYSPAQVASSQEMNCFATVWFLVWLLVFVAGLVEYYWDVPHACGPACLDYASGNGQCECTECFDGFFNAGEQCFAELEDMPAIRTGGGLGGTMYLMLVVLTQTTGVFVEVALIYRLKKRGLLPKKELVVLSCALVLEVSRMLLVDSVMLQQYFSGRSFHIFQVPAAGEECAGVIGHWRGPDKQLYCRRNASSEDSIYYIATRRDAFLTNENHCSRWGSKSALLDFSTGQGFGGSGYNRFSRLGWVLGGQFGLIYFFATFVNEVADIIFVVPTTSVFGWRCKIFSVALEFFQLGALCPAAIFTHSDCLHYTDPLGVPLHLVREIMVINCFLVWGFILTCIPLALMGLVLLAFFACLSSGFGIVAGQAERVNAIKRWISNVADRMLSDEENDGRSSLRMSAFLGMATVPTLVSGLFLGVLVVIGQSSKNGFSEVLTALILFSDVFFKVGATAITEILDYALHLRVRRALADRAADQAEVPVAPPVIVGTAQPSE